MIKPKVIIPIGLGTNSHEELKYCFELAGAEVEYKLWNELIADPSIMDKYQGAGLAGGFAMGDHLGAGQSLANRMRVSEFKDKLEEKLADNSFPIYSVCNCLQLLAKLDLFPVKVGTVQNDSGKHETGSWDVKTNVNNDSVWLKYLQHYPTIFAPISHGEGRIYLPEKDLQKAKEMNLIAMQYIPGHICNQFRSSRGERYNPNGSIDDIAGFGWDNNLVLFPHFERLHHNYQRDDKAAVKSGKVSERIYCDTPDGVYEPTYLIFKAAVELMKEG